MKKFGEPFKTYEPFKVAHLSFPNTSAHFTNIQKFGAKIPDINELTELTPEPTHTLAVQKPVATSLRILTDDKLIEDGKEKLKQIEIGVAPVANVYPIPPKQKDLSESIKNTMSYFKYYVVELGLNICVGREAKIPEVNFEVDIYSEGTERTDATTHSLAPTDTIRTIKIISGKIGLNITKALQLIPAPIGTKLPDILTIDINPIEFEWKLKRYDIDASGPRNYKARWHIYGTDNVQSFNPTMILRAKKKLRKIYAKARVTYGLKTGFLKPIGVYSDEKEIRILPIG
jgi:hypothetical protein